jgi:hypothetical protein
MDICCSGRIADAFRQRFMHSVYNGVDQCPQKPDLKTTHCMIGSLVTSLALSNLRPQEIIVIFVIGAVFFLFGWFLGGLFALNGFDEAKGVKDLKSPIRVRNLNYVIGAFAIALMGDFNKFGIPNGLQTALAPACFLVGFLINLFVSLARLRRSIRLSVRDWNARHPACQLDAERYIRIFNKSGELAFNDIYDEETQRFQKEEKDAEAIRANLALANSRTGDAIRRQAFAGRAVSLAAYSTIAHLLQSDGQRRIAQDRQISALLEAAVVASRAFALDPNSIVLSASLMAFWEINEDAETCERLAEQARYRFDHPETRLAYNAPHRYRGFLELKSGSQYHEGFRVVLPVEHPGGKPDWVLPGAPRALWSPDGIEIVNVKPLDVSRCKGVPVSIQKELHGFFQQSKYSSLACIKIKAEKTLGVLIIESSEPDFLRDPDATAQALTSLQTIAALLSSVLHKGALA